MHDAKPTTAQAEAIPIHALALAEMLRRRQWRKVAQFPLDGFDVTIASSADSLWALVRRDGGGGLALRLSQAAFGHGPVRKTGGKRGPLRLTFDNAIGRHSITLAPSAQALPMLRCTVAITPQQPLLVTALPRDLYPFGRGDDVAAAGGVVEAAQRGLNSGLCYGRLTDPDFGSFLYFQNLTALNAYFAATDTRPDGCVGGLWPELGYLPPTPQQAPVSPQKPLPAGRATIVSDIRLVLDGDGDGAERSSALRFLRMLGTVYHAIERPETECRDWVWRAERTAHDLAHAPEASVRHYGHRYVRPYTAAEYPDSMVQLSLAGALRDWAMWLGEPVSLQSELAEGLGKFFDARLGTIRRYLPNVGKDKDKDAVDSWYLYHALMNLAKLALDGSRSARRLFLASLEFAIRAAKHFDYAWPIQYNVTDFSVITASRNEDGLGQTDVGGIYAHVMLMAHELTGEGRYLDEAKAALVAARDMRFELNYQANLTAWGAAACARLWRITNDLAWLKQSYVYLASFFHNAEIWESQIGHARHYSNFLGVTALHDGPYMALYECFDSFCAFEAYLKDSGPELDPAVRMLVSEYCKYALFRAWNYYPDTLPPEALATEIRNGHIDPKLSFPLEDLYADGQPAGQVGQEVYGAGAAFAFATRAFHRIEGAPFLLFCDHFLLAQTRIGARALSVELGGGDGCTAQLSLVRLPRRALPRQRIEQAGRRIRPHHRADDRVDFKVAARGRITLHW